VSGENATSVVLKQGLVPVLGGHGAVALEKLLGVVAALGEMVSVPVPAANCAAVLPFRLVIVVFAGMPLPMMICPTLGGVAKEAL